MRQLASIQKITKIEPIANAEKLELATVLGWAVVVKKNEFKVGDLVIYCEIDSILPAKPEFAFLQQRHYRIKTIRLRGQLSQGIIFPLSTLPIGTYNEGDDVTEIMGVIKYEPQVSAQLMGQCRGNFPSGVHKTDETRIQSDLKLIDEFIGKEVYITTKCDGSSATYANLNGDHHICSRNMDLIETEGNTFWKIYHKYNLKDVLDRNPDIAIQGELCGPGIQKNPMGLVDHKLFVFNVFDVKAGRYFDYVDLGNFCANNKLDMVPVEEICVFNFTLDQLLERAKGVYPESRRHKEGIVIRPTIETYSPTLRGRSSFKVINNDFLEKDEE